VDIPPRDKKAREFNSAAGNEIKSKIIQKSRQQDPYRENKEMILSGGSHDRGVNNSTKTIDTMSALSEIKLGPVANQQTL
jgi:hypothetical protein